MSLSDDDEDEEENDFNSLEREMEQWSLQFEKDKELSLDPDNSESTFVAMEVRGNPGRRANMKVSKTMGQKAEFSISIVNRKQRGASFDCEIYQDDNMITRQTAKVPAGVSTVIVDAIFEGVKGGRVWITIIEPKDGSLKVSKITGSLKSNRSD